MLLILSPFFFKTVLIPVFYAIIVSICLEIFPKLKEKWSMACWIFSLTFLFMLVIFVPTFTEKVLEARLWKSIEAMTASTVAMTCFMIFRVVVWVVKKIIGQYHLSSKVKRRRTRNAARQHEGCFARATRRSEH